MFRLRLFLLVGLLLQSLTFIAQSRFIDSLRTVIQNEADRQKKFDAIILLCGGGGNVSTDTLEHYIYLAEKYQGDKKNDTNAAQLAVLKCIYYTKTSKNDSALVLIEKFTKMYANNPGRVKQFIEFSMLRSRILDRENKYAATLNQLYDVLNLAKQYNDTLNIIASQTGIGWVQMEMEQYQESLVWFYRAKGILDDKPFAKNYSALFSNIAAAYNKIGRNDSAEHYINIAIRYGRESEMFTFLATSLNIAADIYIDTKQKEKAEAALKEAIETRKKVSDPFYIVYDMSRLANWYAHNGRPLEGIEICNKGIEQAKKAGLSSQVQLMYRALAECYRASGNTEKYSETLEKIIAQKDSFNTINSSKLLAELQGKYEGQKQENVIMQQRFDLARQNYILYGSMIVLLFATVIGIILFRDYRRKERMRELASIENEKKRIAADLHDNLGAYANAVLYNTELLQQETDTSGRQTLMNDLRYASKDIITSLRETIWALKKDDYTAEDCLLRIRNFIHPFTRYYPHLNFAVEGVAPANYSIHGTKALHLVRMVQEAVNNAIKHAEAKNIIVSSVVINNQWQLTVKDDGKGFKQEDMIRNAEQNGLANLQARAESAGIKLSITSLPTKGTTIDLEISSDAVIQK